MRDTKLIGKDHQQNVLHKLSVSLSLAKNTQQKKPIIFLHFIYFFSSDTEVERELQS